MIFCRAEIDASIFSSGSLAVFSEIHCSLKTVGVDYYILSFEIEALEVLFKRENFEKINFSTSFHFPDMVLDYF
jgi:hypothetical protein